MERRTIIVIVALAVASLLFLVLRDASDGGEEVAVSEVTPATVPTAVPEDGAADGATAVPSPSGELVWDIAAGTEQAEVFAASVSEFGGSLKSVALHNPQYARPELTGEKRSRFEKTYGIPAARLDPGPYEVVTTWDAGPRISESFYPFQLVLRKVSWKESLQVVRLVRAGAVEVGAQTRTRLRFTGAAAPEDLLLARGDRIVGTGLPADLTVGKVVGPDEVEASSPIPPEAPAEVRIERHATPEAHYAADSRYFRIPGEERGLRLVWPNPWRDTSPVWIERRWEVAGEYTLRHRTKLHNLASSNMEVEYDLKVNGWTDPEAEPPGMFSPPVQHLAPVCFVDGSLVDGAALSPGGGGGGGAGCGFGCTGGGKRGPGSERHPGQVGWFGINSQYFLLAGVFQQEGGVTGDCQLEGEANGVVRASFGPQKSEAIPGGEPACLPDWFPEDRRGEEMTCSGAMKALGVDEKHLDRASLDNAMKVFAGEQAEARRLAAMLAVHGEARGRGAVEVLVYAGPKDIDRLDEVSRDLSESMDFWFVGFLAKPMLSLLNWLNALLGSWPLAIILLTIIIKLLTLPLTQKSFVNMQRMSTLKPEMDELREKYQNDKQKLQQETMNLYKRHNMNPLSGCFPMLIQMPIWFALYRCIYNAVDLYQAPLFGWIGDMTQPDPYYVLPILLGIFMLVQQMFMPTAAGTDPTQQKIIKYVMPVMFTVFMLMLPAGLVFYIAVSTLLSLGQQWFIKRKYGQPQPAAATAGSRRGR